MTIDDYRYVTGKPCKVPVWGKELAEKKYKKKTVLTITSAQFAPSMENTAMIVGIRSKWEIDDINMRAKIVGMDNWTAEVDRWYQSHGNDTVSAGHRALLASFLMARWSMGKLRGRIDDTL